MLPWFTLFAISLRLPVSQASTTSLIPRADPCSPVCTPTADINPADPNAHICTDTVILMVAQCNDCEGQLSLDGGTDNGGTDNYDELQAEVNSFISSCNIAGFKVKDLTVKGTYTGFNSSVVGSTSQGAGNATATDTAAGAGATGQTKPNGSSSSNSKLGGGILLALIIGALGSAVF
ncbi:hypothetical protein DFH09DRAFT_1136063 [Mycena vulgaris]|nr:hypothetical protein DFH09DRAFT_1136063 [Mycena vulgaris]